MYWFWSVGAKACGLVSGVASPFSMPDQIDIRVLPANTRLRKTVRWVGRL